MHAFILLFCAILLVSCKRPSPDRVATTEGTELAESADTSASARVVLSIEAERTAGIAIDSARREGGDAVAGWLTVPGQIEAEPARVSIISPRVGGRLERLDAVVGQRVTAGQTVAQLYSPAFMTAQGDFQLALYRAEALRGTADSTGARALAASARRRLMHVGASEDDIDRLVRGGVPQTLLSIRAPGNGSLVEQGALPGASVEPGSMLFRLIDLSEVDVVAEVPERELQQLRIGQVATITIAALPDARFTGVIERIRDELEPTTRTIAAVLHVSNPKGELRPGMFATVALGVTAGTRAHTAAVSIPESAVLMDGTKRIVFVAVAPQTYERREVTIVPLGATEPAEAARRRVLVTAGLHAGESVVTAGAFTLKSELGKAAYAEDE